MAGSDLDANDRADMNRDSGETLVQWTQDLVRVPTMKALP